MKNLKKIKVVAQKLLKLWPILRHVAIIISHPVYINRVDN